MQSANAVLPARAFAPATLMPPRQALIAYFGRVAVAPTGTEQVALDDAAGRVLARSIVADDDYPNAPRAAMDGFAVCADAAPGRFEIGGGVHMGAAPIAAQSAAFATRIPTGGIVPAGADAVVPFESARIADGAVLIEGPVARGDNVIAPAADMRRGETVLHSRRRLRACDVGVLATLGITAVDVYRRPSIAVLSTGDELVEPAAQPRPGQIRDSNRYAIAASLNAMGAVAMHHPTLNDEAEPLEAALTRALAACDAVVVTGGSSVGDRDRLPDAVARIADPGVVVHGVRVRPGKPTLLGAHLGKPILGLPGNPTSAILMLEAVAAPIVAALCGAAAAPATTAARLASPVRGRPGWTWYVPVRLQHDGGVPLAHPLPLQSFSVSLTARADGYIVVDECEHALPLGAPVTVYRFLGAS